MVSVAVWSAPRGGRPQRLHATSAETETALEEWVKSDPSLVRDGLVVVAQQLIFPTRERLDLLCVEGRSRWVVVELKRDRMAREVAAQALDYVSLLAAMPTHELASRLAPHLEAAPQGTRDLVADLLAGESDDNPRDIAAVVVGVTADEPLLRITAFLTEGYDVPISVVELQAFQSPSGDLLILREETGSNEPEGVVRAAPSASVEDRWMRVRTNAETRGFGDALTEFTTLVEGVGLYVRPYTRSVMITPPGQPWPIPRSSGLRRHRRHSPCRYPVRCRRVCGVLPRAHGRPGRCGPGATCGKGNTRPARRLRTRRGGSTRRLPGCPSVRLAG